MKKLRWLVAAVALVAVVVVVWVPSEDSDPKVQVQIIDLSPKVVGEYDCVMFTPEHFGEAVQVEAAPGCKSFKVLTSTPPRKGEEPCHVSITRINVPLVEPPVLMQLGGLNPFQGKGCKRAVWSVKPGFILHIGSADVLTVDYVNQGSIKVKQPPKVEDLPPEPQGRES